MSEIDELAARLLAVKGRIRQPRAYNARAVALQSAIDCSGDECLTQQHLKDEVDVNTIVRRFGIGQLPQARAGAVYGDFTGITDYESALAAIERAQAGFMGLPAEVREKYGNDPGRFLREAESVDDPDSLVPAPEAPVPDATLNDVVEALRAAVPPVPLASGGS